MNSITLQFLKSDVEIWPVIIYVIAQKKNKYPNHVLILGKISGFVIILKCGMTEATHNSFNKLSLQKQEMAHLFPSLYEIWI